MIGKDESSECCVDQHLRAVALLVGVVEELCDDDSLFVRDINARIGNPIEERILASDLIVQDSVFTDRFGVDVGEQSVGNVLLLFEFRENVLIVIRDRIELDVRSLEFLEGIAQLTELRPTRGSPHRRSIEDDDGFRMASALVIIDELPVGIGKSEVRESLADLRTGRVSVRKTGAPGVAQWSGCIESVVVALYRHAHTPVFFEMLVLWH